MMTLNAAVELFRDCKTADDVANVLRAEEIKGNANNPCRCPVARLFSKHTGKRVSVGRDNVFAIQDVDTPALDLPRPVQDFIELFDERRTRVPYADLAL